MKQAANERTDERRRHRDLKRAAHRTATAPSRISRAAGAPAGSQDLQDLHRREISAHRVRAVLPAEESARASRSRTCACAARKDFRDAVVAARAALSRVGPRAPHSTARRFSIESPRCSKAARRSSSKSSSRPACATSAAHDRSASQHRPRSLLRRLGGQIPADFLQRKSGQQLSHFNFSLLEPTGVVSILAPENPGLLGLLSVICPTIAGGNTCIALASTSKPLCAVTLSEVLATSDLPGGVINLLTGERTELIEHFASHMDVNADDLLRRRHQGTGDDPHEGRAECEARRELRSRRLDERRCAEPVFHSGYAGSEDDVASGGDIVQPRIICPRNIPSSPCR